MTSQAPRKAVGYLCVSNVSKKRQPAAFLRQTQIIKVYARLTRRDIVGWVRDVVGRKNEKVGDRWGFQRASEVAAEHGCPIIVADYSVLTLDHETLRSLLTGRAPVLSAWDGGAPTDAALAVRSVLGAFWSQQRSKRSKDALAIDDALRRKRVSKLARFRSAKQRTRKAAHFAEGLREVLVSYGASNDAGRDRPSLAQLAQRLNADGHRTPRGKEWTPTAVRRVLARL